MSIIKRPVTFINLLITLVVIAICGSEAVGSPIQEQTAKPATIRLTGIARDFRPRNQRYGHPDFENVPEHGLGHYAGNVAIFLGEDRRPIFTGGGYVVRRSWTDSENRPIAPHLFNSKFKGGGAINNSQAILEDSELVDAVEINFASAIFNPDGTSTWVYRVRELDEGEDLVSWTLELEPSQRVMDGTTKGFEVIADPITDSYGVKWNVNPDFTTGEFVIVLDKQYLGGDEWDCVKAVIGTDEDEGDMFIPTDQISTGGSPFDNDGNLIYQAFGDTKGSRGASDNGGITSAETFSYWFRDAPGINSSVVLGVTLTQQQDGTYLFDHREDPIFKELGGYFPLEGQLFGDSGYNPNHNYHFTFTLRASFVYDSSAAQTFQFEGDDDVWVYVDGKLAIDLGGIHSPTKQYIDIDRFGLIDGQTYSLDFFFVERHMPHSNFLISTNFILKTATLPTVSGQFD